MERSDSIELGQKRCGDLHRYQPTDTAGEGLCKTSYNLVYQIDLFGTATVQAQNHGQHDGKRRRRCRCHDSATICRSTPGDHWLGRGALRHKSVRFRYCSFKQLGLAKIWLLSTEVL